MISDIVKNIVPSGTVAINLRVLELVESGTDIINLSVGEPDFNTPDEAKNGAINAINNNKTRYDKVAGLPELRNAIIRKLRDENGLSYSAEEIVVSNGAKQSITNLCFTVLNPGDEVLIPVPYWVSYPEIVKIAGGVPVFVETARENDFKLTAADIKAHISPKTKMIILCNPSNPLGTVHTREELSDIADVCIENDIWILSDEVYERICFAGEFVSMAAVSEEAKRKTLLVNGLSKSIPMTGWRIGYTATIPELAKAMTAFQGHITSHPALPSQWAGAAALERCGSYTEMMVAEYRKRMERAVSFLRAELPEAPFIEPKGAFYIFLDISCVKDALNALPGSSGSVSRDFTMKLLNDKFVAVAPGAAFGMDGFIRIAYANTIENIMEGLSRIRDLVKNLRG